MSPFAFFTFHIDLYILHAPITLYHCRNAIEGYTSSALRHLYFIWSVVP